MGPAKVLFVRMNADLLVGEDLKETSVGNLFAVFGEPDIEVHGASEGEHVVEPLGIDVHYPTTGQVRSGETDQVARWMVDTAHDGEPFFVHHCYFTGGSDPLKRLKTALKADSDAGAWGGLYATVTRPFSTPITQRIAVKVINGDGDEVMEVSPVS